MVKLVKAFTALVALLPGHFAAGAGLGKKPFPDAEEFPSSLEAGGADPPLPEGQRRLSLENEGKGCWGFCEEKGGDCAYCGTGQCCRAVDYRNQVAGCELAENAVGARCGAYKGSGFPALMNVGLPCIGWCDKQPGDCDYCGSAGQCCRPFDGDRCVPGCELASEDSWMMPGSQCGQFKDPSAARDYCPPQEATSAVPSASPSVSSSPTLPCVEDPVVCLAIDMSGSVCSPDFNDGTPCVVFDYEGCNPYEPDFDPQGMVCANDGQEDEAYCNYEYGPGACVIGCPQPCSNCPSQCQIGSVTNPDSCCENFANIQDFSTSIVDALDAEFTGAEFSAVRFSETATTISIFASKMTVNPLLENLDYTGGLTNHAAALDQCQKTFDPENPSRSRITILLTDGVPNRPTNGVVGAEEAETTAASVRDTGTFILPVFIAGSDPDAIAYMNRLSSDGAITGGLTFDNLGAVVDEIVGAFDKCTTTQDVGR